MARLTPKQLDKALADLAAANNAAAVARNKIMEHCEEVYGCSPGDVDFDEFVDACDGGCGMSAGMSAKDFNTGMRAAKAAMKGV